MMTPFLSTVFEGFAHCYISPIANLVVSLAMRGIVNGQNDQLLCCRVPGQRQIINKLQQSTSNDKEVQEGQYPETPFENSSFEDSPPDNSPSEDTPAVNDP